MANNYKELLLNLANNLNKIYNYSKSLHWNAYGINYYSDHLLYERISEDIQDLIDGLIETCLIPIQSKSDIVEDFSRVFESGELGQITPEMLLNTIIDTIKLADGMSLANDVPQGIKTFLTDTSKLLLVKGGLLDRRLK